MNDLSPTESAYRCHKCRVPSRQQVGRKEECEKCRSDLHVCLNCVHYDQRAYNECREPQADRVLEKDRSNFCDYFSFRKSTSVEGIENEKSDALKKLDDLFK